MYVTLRGNYWNKYERLKTKTTLKHLNNLYSNRVQKESYCDNVPSLQVKNIIQLNTYRGLVVLLFCYLIIFTVDSLPSST